MVIVSHSSSIALMLAKWRHGQSVFDNALAAPRQPVAACTLLDALTGAPCPRKFVSNGKRSAVTTPTFARRTVNTASGMRPSACGPGRYAMNNVPCTDGRARRHHFDLYGKQRGWKMPNRGSTGAITHGIAGDIGFSALAAAWMVPTNGALVSESQCILLP